MTGAPLSDAYVLKCSRCGRRYPVDSLVWRCECGSPLDLVSTVGASELYLERTKGGRSSMYEYVELLPVDPERVVSLGEGCTPIVERDYRGVELHLKLEYLNPTGSFKDRGASLMISHLASLGLREIVEDSSGNAGAAVAAYSSAAGIKCKIFVPAHAPGAKLAQIRAYGAEVVVVEGDREKVAEEARSAAARSYYASHLWNPFFVEGIKTISYEALEQAGYVSVVLAPVGSGGLALGLYKGFREAREAGIVDSIPRLYGVQAESCAPVYEMLHGGLEVAAREGPPLADGIAVPSPPRKRQVAEAIKESRGDVVLVSDSEIASALRKLARWGFLVEPASATALAALDKLVDSGEVDRGERALVPLTGTGLKTIDRISLILGR